MSSRNGAGEHRVGMARGSFSRSTSSDSQPTPDSNAPYGKSAVTSAESGVCESRRRRMFCALTSNHGGVHMPILGISQLYASGAYSDSMENNTGRSFPQCRLDAWQRPGNLRQAGYVHISSYCRRWSKSRPAIHHMNLREDVFSQEEC